MSFVSYYKQYCHNKNNITNSKSEKLLGLKFDHKLSFGDEMSELCKKDCRKIHALSRVAS